MLTKNKEVLFERTVRAKLMTAHVYECAIRFWELFIFRIFGHLFILGSVDSDLCALLHSISVGNRKGEGKGRHEK